MRRFLLTLAVICLGVPVAAGAFVRAPGDGRLTIDNGRGAFVIQAVGGLVARFDSGRILVEDDIGGSGVAITGADRVRQMGPNRVLYIGQDVHVLIRSDTFNLRITAVGADLGLVGRGSVLLDGTGFSDAGRFQVNGLPWRPVPTDSPLRLQLNGAGPAPQPPLPPAPPGTVTTR